MGWSARLELGFAAQAGATWLAHRAHEGPLLVQRPFRPEGPEVSHVYVLHPPGGLVGGDSLTLDVCVGAGASALVTTPAAGKAYRTNGLPARQTNTLRVEAGGTLEWLPQETIVFDGADATLETRVDLAPGARFIGLETICFGLPARREPFLRGACRQRFELSRAGRPLFIERGRFGGGDAAQGAHFGLGGAVVLALLACAPAPAAGLVDELRARAAAAPAEDRGALTVLGEGEVLVARYLGASAERTRGFLIDCWRLLRPAFLGRPAVAPRIWAT